jgi:hypothetical protein
VRRVTTKPSEYQATVFWNVQGKRAYGGEGVGGAGDGDVGGGGGGDPGEGGERGAGGGAIGMSDLPSTLNLEIINVLLFSEHRACA